MAVQDINTITITGRLTKDSELRYTPKGNPVCNFSIASNRLKKIADGEYEEAPNFVDCVLLGIKAEKLAEWLKKGVKVCLQGELRYESWEKDGQKRSKHEIIVERVIFMSQHQESGEPIAVQHQSPAYQEPEAGQPGLYDRDIPF